MEHGPGEKAAAWAAAFPPHRGYLNTAAVGLPPHTALERMREAVEEWGRGGASGPNYDPVIEASRGGFARLLGVHPSQVAVGTQVSVFMAVLVASLPPGSELLLYRHDFTSVLFPALVAADNRRLRIRFVDRLEDLADAVRRETTLVALSAVQSSDGVIAPMEYIAAAARSAGALVALDATHACGWLPLHTGWADFVLCAGYKWLLAPRGTAFMAVGEDRLSDLVPIAAGWYAGEDRWNSVYGTPLRLAQDARRFDVSPMWLAWGAAAAALEVLVTAGVDAVHRHNVALTNALREHAGLPPSDSAIVALDIDADDARRLERAGVRGAMRAGRLRLSFHLYNDQGDVALVADALGYG